MTNSIFESHVPDGHERIQFTSHKAWKAAAAEHGLQTASYGKHSFLHSRATKTEEGSLGVAIHGEFKPHRSGAKIYDLGSGHLNLPKKSLNEDKTKVEYTDIDEWKKALRSRKYSFVEKDNQPGFWVGDVHHRPGQFTTPIAAFNEKLGKGYIKS